MKKLLFLFLFSHQLVFSQDFTATVSKKNISVGEEFQIIFSARGNSKDFKPPSFLGLRKLSGPNKSSSSSMQIINNKVSSSKSTSYSYYMTALNEGKLTIGSASIKIEGKTINSEPIVLNVSKADPNKKGGFNINENVEIKVSVNKTNVFQGEQIVVNYKLFSKINLTDISVSQFPELNNFWKDEIETNSRGEIKVIDGVKYNVWEVSKSILTPQKSGELIIDPMKLEITVQLKTGNNRRDIFGMFNNYKTIVEEINSKSITINVKDLPPNPPPSFNGAVGNFELNSKIDKQRAKTNTAINYQLELSGSGNLNLIDNIPVNFSDDFEVFDPQKEDKSFIAKNGIRGKLLFNHLIIPRYQGDYIIPTQEFTFFDTKSNRYKTINTKSYEIRVDKGNNDATYVSNNANSNVSENTSLKPLKNNTRFYKANQKPIYKTWWYIILSVLPFISLITYFARKKYFEILDNDPIQRKFRKSLKIAQKRLKNAENLLKNNEKLAFYEEIEKSLLQYFSQKFNIETSDLSKETITTIFDKHNIDKEALDNFISIIEDCEFCRFAPSALESKDINTVYTNATKIIVEIEKQLS
ncbi:MAG: BatD family protein [Flavobacteriales bacterium]